MHGETIKKVAMICLFFRYWDDQIKKDEMSGHIACMRNMINTEET